MKRPQIKIFWVIFASALLLPFSNCQRTVVRPSSGSITPQNNGTTVGNPLAPISEKLAARVCETIVRCHPQANMSSCRDGLSSTAGFSQPLGLTAQFDIFSAIALAEQSGALTGHTGQSDLCTTPLEQLDCSSPAVVAAFQPQTSTPFAQAAGILPQSQCQAVFTLPSYGQEVLADQPIAYWHLNESSGLRAIDSVQGTIGTYSASTGLTMGIPGALANDAAVRFSSPSTTRMQATLPTINQTSGQFVTVEFWLQWSGSPGTGGGMMAINLNSSGYGLWLYPQQNGFGFNTGTGDLFGIQGPTVTQLAGRWVHVVAIFENGVRAGNMPNNKIYLDGVEQSLSMILAPSSTPLRSANPFIAISDAGSPLDGVIDEVAIYNTALSANRIQRHHQAGR